MIIHIRFLTTRAIHKAISDLKARAKVQILTRIITAKACVLRHELDEECEADY